MMQKSVLYLGIASFALAAVLMMTTISIANAQQQYEFVTQWGSEGPGPGQFNGQNDVDPFQDNVFVADYDNKIEFKSLIAMVNLSQAGEVKEVGMDK